ncbi:hypothetical protein MMC25_006485 [Agyrium rufum]|nr:hypothetical protein [Agyrium rufum]
MAYQIIDTEGGLRSVLRKLYRHPNDPPSFYMDAQGHKLGRTGTLDILQIYILPLQETLVVDIYTLQRKAFNVVWQGYSLKSFLQSATVTKVVFDVRNVADALLSHYEVSLNGVIDLQMMEYYCPKRTGNFLRGLGKCITDHSSLPLPDINEWSLNKDKVLQGYKDADDTQRRLFQRRPMSKALLTCLMGNVVHLPLLFTVYRNRLAARDWDLVKIESQKRSKLSQSPNYDPEGLDHFFGPSRLPATVPSMPELSTVQHNGRKAPVPTTQPSVRISPNANQALQRFGLGRDSDPSARFTTLHIFFPVFI